MLDIMDKNKRERIISVKEELEQVLEELRLEKNENVPTDDFIPVSTAVYYLDRAINYQKYNS